MAAVFMNIFVFLDPFEKMLIDLKHQKLYPSNIEKKNIAILFFKSAVVASKSVQNDTLCSLANGHCFGLPIFLHLIEKMLTDFNYQNKCMFRDSNIIVVEM